MTTDSPVIDVHSHWVSPAYAATARPQIDKMPTAQAAILRSVREASGPVADLSIRLEEMDRDDIDVSVLSLPPPGVTLGAPSDRPALASLANDEFLEAADAHPRRLAVLLALPLPDVDASLGELERVAGRKGARGLNLQCVTSEGWTLDDPAFVPIYRRAAELGLPALAHPAIEPLPDAWTDFLLQGTLAPVTSSSLGVARMVLSGLLDQVPSFEVIVPHLGGVLPYLAQRFADFGNQQAEHDLPWYLRHRLYFDTCSYHPPAFRCAVDTCGVDRLVMGTDYPIRGPIRRAVDDIRAALPDDADARQVLGTTAARWFSVG